MMKEIREKEREQPEREGNSQHYPLVMLVVPDYFNILRAVVIFEMSVYCSHCVLVHGLAKVV